MATVICSMVDCKYRSKRPSRKWFRKDGEKCYGCTRDAIVVSEVFDPDGDVEAVCGKENMTKCLYYTPLGE